MSYERVQKTFGKQWERIWQIFTKSMYISSYKYIEYFEQTHTIFTITYDELVLKFIGIYAAERVWLCVLWMSWFFLPCLSLYPFLSLNSQCVCVCVVSVRWKIGTLINGFFVCILTTRVARALAHPDTTRTLFAVTHIHSHNVWYCILLLVPKNRTEREMWIFSVCH